MITSRRRPASVATVSAELVFPLGPTDAMRVVDRRRFLWINTALKGRARHHEHVVLEARHRLGGTK